MPVLVFHLVKDDSLAFPIHPDAHGPHHCRRRRFVLTLLLMLRAVFWPQCSYMVWLRGAKGTLSAGRLVGSR
jgi:hypothetical protein